jgi:signal transduction histidine kinase/ActR/RegA family two-component response regulator
MLSLHAPTLFAFHTLISATIGVLLIWIWLGDRGQPALATWGAARLCGALAMPLLAMRDVIPNWMSIDLANAIICLGYGLTWAGARQFEGRPVIMAVPLVGPVGWLLACEVPVLHAHLEARVACVGLILSAYLLAAAWEFQRGQARQPLPSRPLLIVLLGAMSGVYFVSGGLPLVFPFGHTGTALPDANWFGLLFMLCISLLSGSTILLVALTKEAAQLRSTSALAAARDLATEASGQKTRFLARMSHELRTPLNGMLGLAQVLARDPEQNDRQRRQAATLEQAGRHLLEILNEVLDLSRIEAGKLELSLRPVILADFIRETLALAQASATTKTILLEQVSARVVPEAVLADPRRLRQILLNLLSNALKFTPNGGRVLLSLDRMTGDTLRFTVADSGPGVPASLRPCLFEDYTQGPGDSALGGSGLGLPISARLAEAMQGTLTYTDGVAAEGVAIEGVAIDGIGGGRGSCFTLTVPLPAVVRPAASTPALPRTPPNRLRILVVDDIALNRLTARAMLEHAGHTVDLAEDGAAALAALARAPRPDIILIDQMMPDMNGQELTRRIRMMDGAVGRLPILAVTAGALPEDVEACLDAGMDGHVAKPIELEGLLSAIARALDRTGVAA